jgi:NADH-ubiquinone oxidoreductase chain 5
MAIPLGILAVLSVVFGYLSKDLFIGVGTDFFGNVVFIHSNSL